MNSTTTASITRPASFTSNYSNNAPAGCRNAVLDAEYFAFPVSALIAAGYSADVIVRTLAYLEQCRPLGR